MKPFQKKKSKYLCCTDELQWQFWVAVNKINVFNTIAIASYHTAQFPHTHAQQLTHIKNEYGLTFVTYEQVLLHWLCFYSICAQIGHFICILWLDHTTNLSSIHVVTWHRLDFFGLPHILNNSGFHFFFFRIFVSAFLIVLLNVKYTSENQASVFFSFQRERKTFSHLNVILNAYSIHLHSTLNSLYVHFTSQYYVVCVQIRGWFWRAV